MPDICSFSINLELFCGPLRCRVRQLSSANHLGISKSFGPKQQTLSTYKREQLAILLAITK
jgi:hypothetical protein